MKSGARTTRLALLLAATLTAGLAACASQVGADAAQPARSHTGSKASPTATAASGSASQSAGSVTASLARVPASARRLTCPAGAVSLSALGQPTLPLPPGFKPIAVVECIRVIARVPGSGLRITEKRRVAVTGLARLLAALRESSASRNPNGPLPACMAQPAINPWFVLVSADGQAIRPKIPVTLCGIPTEAVLTSLNSMHWITLSTTQDQPVSSSP